MPDTGESLEARLAQAAPLAGAPGQAYVEWRGVPGLMVEPDGRILLEGASEAQDVVLGYIPAGVLA